MWWSSLSARLRTLLTLAVLCVLMLGGVAWGWSQMTEPFPGKVDAPICVDTSYAAGDELSVQEVTVSVLNASSREGLATRTLAELEDAGFAPGQTANAPAGTSLTTPAEIWASDPVAGCATAEPGMPISTGADGAAGEAATARGADAAPRATLSP